MPMPGWWRHLNKRIFNPLTLRKEHDWSMINHVGRSSGKPYSTPVEAIAVPGGYAVFLMYGRNTDWAKNLLASGSGSIEFEGQVFPVENPRIVNISEIDAELPADANRPPSLLKVKELIRMDVAG